MLHPPPVHREPEYCYPKLNYLLFKNTRTLASSIHDFSFKTRRLNDLITHQRNDNQNLGKNIKEAVLLCSTALDDIVMASIWQVEKLEQIQTIQMMFYKEFLSLEAKRKDWKKKSIFSRLRHLLNQQILPVTDKFTVLLHSPMFSPLNEELRIRLANDQLQMEQCLDTLLKLTEFLNPNDPKTRDDMLKIWEQMEFVMEKWMAKMRKRKKHMEQEAQRQQGFAEKHMGMEFV